MVAIHAVFGLFLVALSIFVLIWNVLRVQGRVQSNKVRMAFIGLLDLQILIGIVTLLLNLHVVKASGGWFLLHPIVMISAVVVLHIYTKDTRTERTQLTAYITATLLFIIGLFLTV